MNWLAVLYDSARLAIAEWRDSRDRQNLVHPSPRSSVLVTCDVCHAQVPADAVSMASHRRAHEFHREPKS
jgi:hypothetical protein